MNILLLTAALGLVAPQAPAAPATPAAPQDRAAAAPDKSLDGQWTVVCFEKAGQPMPEAKNMTVKCEGNMITCSGKDGKPTLAMKVTFGPNATIRVTELGSDAKPGAEVKPGEVQQVGGADRPGDAAGRAGTRAGVYVLTQDYLAICIHEDAAGAREGAPREAAQPDEANRASAGNTPSTKSYCTVILRREGAAQNK